MNLPTLCARRSFLALPPEKTRLSRSNVEKSMWEVACAKIQCAQFRMFGGGA